MHLRSYYKQVSNILFLLLFVVTFLVPQLHSHDHSHDNGILHHDFSTVFNYNHPAELHHGKESFGLNVKSKNFSHHNHTNDQHSHSIENQTIRTSRRLCSSKSCKSSFLYSERFIQSAFHKEAFFKVDPLTSSKPYLYSVTFIFVLTDLPPPIV